MSSLIICFISYFIILLLFCIIYVFSLIFFISLSSIFCCHLEHEFFDMFEIYRSYLETLKYPLKRHFSYPNYNIIHHSTIDNT